MAIGKSSGPRGIGAGKKAGTKNASGAPGFKTTAGNGKGSKGGKK
jgi:hypothetical protein